MHISGTFEVPEEDGIDIRKVNIEKGKANIQVQKANIQASFTAKTAAHICRLLDRFGFTAVFGRSDVQTVLDLKATRSTALLKDMNEKGFIEPVAGRGKGKYRFRQKRLSRERLISEKGETGI